MQIIIDAALPDPWIGRIDAAVRMAAASGIAYEVVHAAPTRLVAEARRCWPALVVRLVSTSVDRKSWRLSNSTEGAPAIIPIIGYVRRSEIEMIARAIHDRWELQGLLIEDVSDKPWDVIEAFQSAQSQALGRWLESELVAIAGQELGQVFTSLISDGRKVTVPLLADRYGASRRTLRRHFAKAGLPRPERWVSWMNVIMAGAYLNTGKRTIDSVALALGFESGAALSQVCRRLTGSGLSAFVQSRGLKRLLGQFRQECGAPVEG